MTRYTIDASVVLAKALDEPRPAWVDEVVASARGGGLELAAPTLMWIECGNRLVRGMSDEHALEAMLRIDALDIEEVELHRPVRVRALQLARAHRLTMYDSTYLAVAEAVDAPLLTLDHRLDRAVVTMGLGRAGSRGVSEPAARYGEDRPVDRTAVAAIGAALAEMREAYSG